MGVVRGLEPTTYMQRLGELNFFRMEKRCQLEDVSVIYRTFWVVVEKVEPDFSLRCAVMGQEADTRCG